MITMRKIAVATLIIGMLLVGFGIWYKYEFSMSIARAYELNNRTASEKMLIATQGSDFKDEITQGIIDRFKDDSLFIKVIDISSLGEANPKQYNAIVILHTWENWKPPMAVESFINRNRAFKDRIVVLTTSGDGTYKMDDVDAITGESRMEDTSIYIERITQRLQMLLNP